MLIMRWCVLTGEGQHRFTTLNVLKAWREAEPVSLVTMVKERDELGAEVPNSTNPALLLYDDSQTPSQRADVARLQQHYADMFSPLPGCTTLIQHFIETRTGVTVKIVQWELKADGSNRKVQQCLV